MKIFLKFVTAIVAFSFGVSTASVANADNSNYWPEFGTMASHNAWAMKAIGGDIAHQIGATGAGVKVAVLDSGVSPNIPGLTSKIIAYKDFVSSQHPLQEHGSLTASTVAADYDPATGVGGIAPGVSLIIGRVCYLSSCDSEAAKKAILWATAQGAQVISMSFGGYNDPEMNAILNDVTRRGVVVVAALGNSGCTTYGGWGVNRYCLQGKSTENSMA
ncbi:MAG: S8 family serine peptidase, partial [Actinomycetes bacterium]